MTIIKKIIPWILICLLGSYAAAWHWLGGNPYAIWQIYNTLQRVETAIEEADSDTLLAHLAPDAQHRGLTSGRLVEGEEEWRELMAEEATEESADAVETQIKGVRFVSPDVVLIDVTIIWTNYRLDNLLWPEYREHTFIVFARNEGGNWQLANTNAGGHDSSLDAPAEQP